MCTNPVKAVGLQGILDLTFGVGACLVHVGCEILSDQHHDGVLRLEVADHLVAVVHVRRTLRVGEVLGGLNNRRQKLLSGRVQEYIHYGET